VPAHLDRIDVSAAIAGIDLRLRSHSLTPNCNRSSTSASVRCSRSGPKQSSHGILLRCRLRLRPRPLPRHAYNRSCCSRSRARINFNSDLGLIRLSPKEAIAEKWDPLTMESL
jgi:hypothetical protein